MRHTLRMVVGMATELFELRTDMPEKSSSPDFTEN